MASPSQIIRDKQKREIKTEQLVPERVIHIDIDGDGDLDEVKYRDAILFIADTPLTGKTQTQLAEHGRIKKFSQALFINRTLDELYEKHDVKMIWVNVRNAQARHWLGVNLPKKSSYFKVISVYKSNKKSKWIKDISEFSTYVVKLGELRKQMDTLDFGGFVSELETLDIHAIQGKMASCMSMFSAKKNKR